MENKLIKALEEIPGIVFYPNEDLTKLTTMRLEVFGDLVVVKNLEALKILLPLLVKAQRKYLVLGFGANQVLPRRVEEIVIKLDFDSRIEELSSVKESYSLPASITLNHLTGAASRLGLSGWEVFTGIPATLGGAIVMNAGTALGEIGKLIDEVFYVNQAGEFIEAKMNTESFSYRKNNFLPSGAVIVGAKIKHFGVKSDVSQKIREYLDYRKSTQPLATKNCGCVFKNPYKSLPAGKLVDLLGLKNLQIGGLKVSSKHGNFIENGGKSNWDDLNTLIGLIKSNMDSFYGIEFELEVKIPYH